MDRRASHARLYRESNHYFYIQVLKPYLSLREGRSLLLLDTFTVHRMPSVIDALRLLSCDPLFIPGGLTPILQPLDISINKPLKDNIRDAYSRWARNSFDPERGLAKPGRKEVAEWVLTAWHSISSEAITNGFTQAGLQI